MTWTSSVADPGRSTVHRDVADQLDHSSKSGFSIPLAVISGSAFGGRAESPRAAGSARSSAPGCWDLPPVDAVTRVRPSTFNISFSQVADELVQAPTKLAPPPTCFVELRSKKNPRDLRHSSRC